MVHILQHPASQIPRSVGIAFFPSSSLSPPQIVEAVGNHARFLLQLYPLFVNSLGDGEDEVCNNAVFGLGVLAANGLPDIEK